MSSALPKPPLPSQPAGDNRRRAVLLMAASMACFSVMNASVKLAADLSAWDKAFFRHVVSMTIMLLIVRRRRVPLLGSWRSQPYLMVRTVTGLVAMVAFFYAIDHITLVDADMLNKMAPFFVSIMAVLTLGERFNRVQLTALPLAFAGALLVLKPSFDVSMLPALIGLSSGLLSGVAYTVLRFLRDRERPETIVFYFAFVSALLLAPLVLPHMTLLSLTDLALMLTIGVSATAAQLLMTSSYRYAPAGEVSIVMYTTIIFSGVFGYFIAGEIPDAWSLLGGGCIIGAALLVYRGGFARRRFIPGD